MPAVCWVLVEQHLCLPALGTSVLTPDLQAAVQESSHCGFTGAGRAGGSSCL